MPGRDTIVVEIIVVEFSALGVEALARLPNIHPRSAELPAFHLVHEPIELATAERP
jgi:recombinational DNA repair protein RecR